MNKIGIFGGTFNPVHSGHLIIADEVLHLFKLDRVIFIPNKIPSHRRDKFAILPSGIRLKMLRLAINQTSEFEISEIELRQNKTSYTYNTILNLKKIYPETKLYFISGSDSLISYSWFKLDEILSMLDKFIIILRQNFSKNLLEKKIKKLNLKNKNKFKIISIPTLDISSSKIRDKISSGESIKYLVPREVESFIKKNKLYAKI